MQSYTKRVSRNKPVSSPEKAELALLAAFNNVFSKESDIPEGVKKILEAYLHELALKFSSLAHTTPQIEKNWDTVQVTDSEIPTLSFQRMYEEIYYRKLEERLGGELKTFLSENPIRNFSLERFSKIDNFDKLYELLATRPNEITRLINSSGLQISEDILPALRDEAINEAIESYSEFVRATVTTNHPTDLFGNEARLALYSFQVNAWNNLPGLWQTGEIGGDDKLEDLKREFQELAGKIKAPGANPTLEQEIIYNSRMAEVSYDAAMELTKRMLSAVEAMGGDPDKFIGKITDRAFMLVKDWIRDGDGKPNKRPGDTDFAASIKRRDINYRYIAELAKLASQVEIDTSLSVAQREKAKWQLKSLIWKRLDMAEDAYIDLHGAGEDKIQRARGDYKQQTWNYITKTLRDKGTKENEVKLLKEVFLDRGFYGEIGVTDERTEIKTERDYPRSDSNWSENFGYINFVREELGKAEVKLSYIQNLIAKAEEEGKPQYYGDLLLSLHRLKQKEKIAIVDVESKRAAVSEKSRYNEELRDHEDERYQNYYKYGVNLGKQGHESKEAFMADIDEFVGTIGNTKLPIVREAKILKQMVNTFGDYSRVSEFRQSAEVYEHTFAEVQEIMKKSKGIAKNLEELGLKPEENGSYSVKQLLEIMDDEKYHLVALRIRAAVSDWLTSKEREANRAFFDFNNGNPSPENAWLFRKHDLLNELARTFKYPGSTNMHLIAECNGADTVLKAQFLTMVMSKGEKETFWPRITMLNEYPKDIMESSEAIKNILSNPIFLKYAQKAAEQHDSGRRMEKYDEEIGKYRKIRLDEFLKQLEKEDKATYDLAMKNIREKAAVEGVTLEKFIGDKTIFDICLMFAGSDANKTASTAIVGITSIFALEESRAAALCFGVWVEEYLGCGTGMHRNHISSALHQTMHQGVGARESHIAAARDTEHVLTVAAANAKGFNLSIGGNRVPEMIAAIHNFGNHLNLQTSREHLEEYRGRIASRIKGYTGFYGDNEFTPDYGEGKDLARLRALPSTLTGMVKLYENSARPPVRVGEKHHPDGVKGDPQTGRAIGENVYWATKGFMPPHMYHGIAKLLGADEKSGNFANKKALEKATKDFRENHSCQDQVNRAIWAITRSDPDMGWKHTAVALGLKESKITRKIDENGDLKILINGKEFSAHQLEKVKDYAALRDLLPSKLKINQEVEKLKGDFEDTLEALGTFDTNAKENLITAVQRVLSKKFNLHEDEKENTKEMEKAVDAALAEKFSGQINSNIYKTMRKALVSYVAKTENILGSIRSAATLDIELTNATKAVNAMLINGTGYKKGGRGEKHEVTPAELADKQTTMNLLEYISPVLHGEYKKDAELFDYGRKEIFEQVKAEIQKSSNFKKPVKETDEGYEKFDEYWRAHALIRTMLNEKPVQTGKSPELAIAAAMHSSYARSMRPGGMDVTRSPAAVSLS